MVDLFSALGDEKSLRLFKAIGTKPGSSKEFTHRLRLSHKEYYTRMSRFIRIGIVKRKQTKYHLTALGPVVHDSEVMMKKAVDNLWKLKALDSIDLSDGITIEERKRLLDSLVGDTRINQLLSSRLNSH